ncbi:MAG: patatin-like phospholipase family protein [Pseudomonadota bacterium]
MAALSIQAGPAALQHLREHGFRPSDVKMMAGASGGAKWLVLAGMDKALLSEVVPQFEGPVHLLGSSIGAWRFGCYTQSDPLAAIERFQHAYVEQTYSEKPTRDEISRVGREMLDYIIGESGAAEIPEHPVFRLHVMAVRARHLSASEKTPVLLTGLTLAMLSNLVSRRALGGFFSRALVSDRRDRAPFTNVDDFPIDHIELTTENVIPAIQASGAIPMVLNGVSPLPGAPDGVYRDGGIIDYHFDVPLSASTGLTLFPHFYEHLTPGWFDKRLKRRKPKSQHLDRVILMSPSPEFVAGLPYGKIPDRQDFKTMAPDERRTAWRRVVRESERLGDELLEWVASDAPANACRPLV